MTEPSKVIHVRNVGPEISEGDLSQLAQTFGVVQKVVMLRAKNQALLQMQDLPSSIQMMQYYTGVQPNIRGRNVYMQFSSHQELTTDSGAGGRRSSDQEQQPNRILLITIHNPLYPITVDVLHQVFSPHGYVEKIVCFQKSAGLQALLQYSNQASAISARTALQGRNIYDGCCTLDIQYSNLQELQVNYNNERTRDYTNAGLPSEQGPRGGVAGNNNIMSSLFGEGGNVYGMPPQGPRPGFQQNAGPGPGMGLGPYQMPGLTSAAAVAAIGGLPPGITGTNDRSVILASNLNAEKVDPDKLFNLFSNYGNVLRVKMLHNKPDHALIQMGDGFQAELAVTYLKQGITLFGKRLDVNFSKHAQINPSPDSRDYSTSNLNRFNRNAAKNYRHCTPPTRMIHVSSLPQEITSEQIINHLSPHGTIVGAKIFESNGKKQALVLFSNEDQALEALICQHASNLEGHTIRLAFSKLTTL
ncbi:hypothetical protein CBR_g7995 [Chara braunii]|uniref:RRM domain-containing protein n=1 Tax=Chara braunii TaxID=69332 RepID=A0A388KKX4_CHABU|nr:hypothetical protein CBR_g7995 [Chara braunii]|eukprot:GBG70696.1 hypothetical protein CBR_g7995 [Chara braunii]